MEQVVIIPELRFTIPLFPIDFNSDDVEWYKELPYTISAPSIQSIFVHAGILPGHAITDQFYYDLCCIRDIVKTEDIGWKPVPPGTTDSVPWASAYGQDSDDSPHIYFGHDAKRGLQLHKFATGLDTGCCYGKRNIFH